MRYGEGYLNKIEDEIEAFAQGASEEWGSKLRPMLAQRAAEILGQEVTFYVVAGKYLRNTFTRSGDVDVKFILCNREGDDWELVVFPGSSVTRNAGDRTAIPHLALVDLEDIILDGEVTVTDYSYVDRIGILEGLSREKASGLMEKVVRPMILRILGLNDSGAS